MAVKRNEIVAKTFREATWKEMKYKTFFKKVNAEVLRIHEQKDKTIDDIRKMNMLITTSYLCTLAQHGWLNKIEFDRQLKMDDDLEIAKYAKERADELLKVMQRITQLQKEGKW